MKKVVVRMACGLLLEDEQGQVLELCGRDAVKKGYLSLRSPLGQAAVRIIQLLEKGEEK